MLVPRGERSRVQLDTAATASGPAPLHEPEPETPGRRRRRPALRRFVPLAKSLVAVTRCAQRTRRSPGYAQESDEQGRARLVPVSRRATDKTRGRGRPRPILKLILRRTRAVDFSP